ncbi:MAG: CBS domain-containing protein [Armatimonadetes bacterium]|nr:CBS domain-containing protein [Armatimonadota bacterium]
MKTKLASQVMTTALVTATVDMLLTEVMNLLVSHGIGCLPVIDEDRNLLGVITAYDVMNAAASGQADQTTVGDAMSKEVLSFSPEDDLAGIVNACLAKRMHRVPIVKDGKAVGLISRRDIIREILALYRQQEDSVPGRL